jgi:hypothetical protein
MRQRRISACACLGWARAQHHNKGRWGPVGSSQPRVVEAGACRAALPLTHDVPRAQAEYVHVERGLDHHVGIQACQHAAAVLRSRAAAQGDARAAGAAHQHTPTPSAARTHMGALHDAGTHQP